MKKLLIWSRVPVCNHCPCRSCYHRAKKYHLNCCPLSTLYLCQNLICPPVSRLYLKELLSILQTVSYCSRYTTFFLFGSRFHRQNLPIPPTLSAIYALTISDRGKGSLNADVSENTLLFESQSINNFSDYDILQSVDWERPSVAPHVLLLISHGFVWRREKILPKYYNNFSLNIVKKIMKCMIGKWRLYYLL